MKKRLLLSVFAVLSAMSSFALNVGDYAYTFTQRFKIVGANLVQNDAFTPATDSWTDAEGNAVSSAVWSIEAGMGPNGENALKSIDATAESALVQAVPVEAAKTYVVSFWIKGEATNTTSGATAFANYDGALVKSDEATSVMANAAYADEWTQVNAVYTTKDTTATQFIVISFAKLTEGLMVTNFSVNEVAEVYDIRVMQNRFAFAKEVMAMDEFNTDASAEARGMLEETILALEGAIEAGEAGGMDDFGTAEGALISFEEMLEAYMGATSVNLVSLIPGLNISSLANWGRAGKYSDSYKLTLWGNWGHLADEADVLRSAIQTGYAHEATYKAFHEDLPAGKYFFSAEIRNGNTTKTSWPTSPVYNLATACKMFIGTDTIETDTIFGENYQRFNMIAEVKEDGQVYAGVYWPGVTSGGAFMIRNTVFRAFDLTVLDKAQHYQAWKTYKAQWDAASARKYTVWDMTDNGNYPWAQDSLKSAETIWGPYYAAQEAKGWMAADSTDAGVATTEELEDWALYQGVEAYSEPDAETGETKRLEYQLVRGYQNAINYVKAQNQVITDLATAIDEAKKVRNKGTNATGDRDAFKTAIETALNTLITTRENTTDATRVADSTIFADAKTTLLAAQEAFIASAEVKPIVDIDFATKAELVTTEEAEYYSIKGTAGEMTFTVFEPDNTVASYAFAQGHNGEMEDRLHVGGDSYGEVALPELGDNDVLVASFDYWFGQLGKAFQGIDLVNAAGTRVAGFSYDAYNTNVNYNDFDNAEGQGMVIKGNVNSANDKSGGAVAVAADNLVNKFTLTIDYKNQTIQGTLNNPKAGKTIEGVAIPMSTAEEADNKIVAFRVVGSNHAKANSGAFGRRAWFDNLVIYRYADAAGDFEEDITQSPWSDKTGIETVGAEVKNTNAIYSIMGVRLNSVPQKGLFIVNGKKYVK